MKKNIWRFRFIELSKLRDVERTERFLKFIEENPLAMDVLREGIEAREDWAMELYFSCLSDRFCPFPELG